MMVAVRHLGFLLKVCFLHNGLFRMIRRVCTSLSTLVKDLKRLLRSEVLVISLYNCVCAIFDLVRTLRVRPFTRSVY